MPFGTTLRRKCTCEGGRCGSDAVCPLRVLLTLKNQQVKGGSFFTYTYNTFQDHLRLAAASAGLADADRLTTHCFRRGAAQYIVSKAKSLSQLCCLGEWRSGAWRHYTEKDGIEAAAIFEAYQESSDEDVV
eukprot:GHVN01032367.1.p1 GENE.GHVN01032367.1~~GHVN01032367.1.p1  ORF type:complete len:131 (+),score=8.81 GHVN01032367.1:783-1175(+)